MSLNRHLPPFLLGFLALSFQVLLLREFSAHFFGNEITYGLILASWLLWGGFGSLFASKVKFNLQRLPQIYYGIIFLFPLCLFFLRFSRIILGTLPGEITGTSSVLVFSFILSFFISFPLGMLFVFNIKFLKGDLTHVYLMESLGAAAAGLAVYFLLVPFFSNWQATTLIGLCLSLSVYYSVDKRKNSIYFASVFIVLGGLFFFDIPSQKEYWKPFTLIHSKDSIYGRLQVIKTEEQISLYNNSLQIYSYPDLAASEESVHFALLQNPNAKNVLLIGGGAGGSLKQLLKYPRVHVDYVELDPEIIRLSLRFLPDNEKKIFHDNRISIHYRDGKSYLMKTQKKFDIIILNLLDPATAQINRFYTKEFFLEVKNKLNESGIFSFRVSSAENYISSELKNFLSSLFFTLKEAFQEIKIVPGNTNIFLASSHPLSLNYQEICQRIENLGLQNMFVTPHLLNFRLNPQRIDFLQKEISAGKKVINLDLTPISYFFHSVLWSTQFKGLEAKTLSFFSRIRTYWILDFPLFFSVVLLFFFGAKRNKTSFLLAPLAVMGLTTIVVEIIVIIAFQTFYGYLYNKISLLFAFFMIGLFLGSLYRKNHKKSFVGVLLIQAEFILLLFLLLISLRIQPPEALFFVFLFLLGFLGGELFIVANFLYLKTKKNYGIGYGLDLLGSFLGAFAASSLLIPLVGLPTLLKYVFLLNSFCLLFLFWGLKKSQSC